jgi:hypothetical protein
MAPHIFPCVTWQPRAEDELEVESLQRDEAPNNGQVSEQVYADHLNGGSSSSSSTNGDSTNDTINGASDNGRDVNGERANGDHTNDHSVNGNHVNGTHVDGSDANHEHDSTGTVPNASVDSRDLMTVNQNDASQSEMSPAEHMIRCLKPFFKGEGPYFKGDGPTEKLCLICDEPASDQRCGNCRVARYCSKECQAKDHTMHRHICEDMGKFNEARRPSGRHFGAVLFPLYGGKPELIWVQHAKGSGTITVDHPDLDRFAQELGYETIPLHMVFCGLIPHSLLFKDRKMDHGVAILSIKPNPVLEDPKFLNKTVSDLGKPGLLDPVFGPLIQVSFTVEEAGVSANEKKRRQRKARLQRKKEEKEGKKAEEERRKAREKKKKQEEEEAKEEGENKEKAKKKKLIRKNKGKTSAQDSPSEAGRFNSSSSVQGYNELQADSSTQAPAEVLVPNMVTAKTTVDTTEKAADQTLAQVFNMGNLIQDPPRLHKQMGSLATAMNTLEAIEQHLLQGLAAAERVEQVVHHDTAALAKNLEDLKAEADKATVDVLANLKNNPLAVVHSSLRDYRTFIYYIQNRRINPCVHDPDSVPCTAVPATRIVDLQDPFNQAMGLTKPIDRVWVRLHHMNPAMVWTLAFLVGLPWYIRDGNTLDHAARPWQGMDLRFFSRVTVCLPNKGGVVDEDGQALKEFCEQTYDMTYSGFFVVVHNRDMPILEHHVLALIKYLQFCVDDKLVPRKKDFQKYWNAYKAVKVEYGESMDSVHSPYEIDGIHSEGRDKDANMLIKQICDDEEVWQNFLLGKPSARYMYKPYDEWRREYLGEVGVRTVARPRRNTAGW